MSDNPVNVTNANDVRPDCKYGKDCYQKNPHHLEKYKHPSRKKKETDVVAKKKIKINDYFKADTSKKFVKAKVNSNDETCSGNSNKKFGDVDTNLRCDQQKLLGDTRTHTSVDDKHNDTLLSHLNSDHSIGTNSKVVQESAGDNVNDVSASNVSLVTEEDKIAFITQKFLVEMPYDFYNFWEFCKTMNHLNPCDALANVGLKLVGPYDVLAGHFKQKCIPDEKYLLHWRYYHDPPEVQTVLKGDDTVGYHIGYFRDVPHEKPSLMISNCALKNGVLECVGDNIFAAVNTYLEELKLSGDPFKKMNINKYQNAIKKRADELHLNLLKKSDKVIERDRKAVARTFNKIGLVVPYNKKTQLGYRPLATGNKELRILLDKLDKAKNNERQHYLSELQPVLTAATIATDECDFGTGLELGWNLMCHGVDCLNSTISRVLTSNYKLLNRSAFAKIIEAHMANRKKGCQLSVI